MKICNSIGIRARLPRGNVLLVTLFVMTMLVMCLSYVMESTGTVTKQTNLNREYLAAQTAAEGAADFAFSIWVKQTNNFHTQLTSAQANNGLVGPCFSGTGAPPGTTGFVYSPATFYNSGTAGVTVTGALTITALSKYGVPLGTNSIPDPVIGPVPGYPGWWGRTYTYAATAVLEPDLGTSGSSSPRFFRAGARRLFQYSEVPMFQTMYFYNDDLEIYNCARTTVNGLVHTNKNLYLLAASGNLTFNGQVSYSGTYTSGAAPPGGSNYISASTTSGLVPPTFNAGVPYLTPTMSAVGSNIQADFPSPYGSNSSPGASTDPNLMTGFHEIIQPPSTATADPPELSQRRLFNNAGLIIQIGDPVVINTTNTAITTVSSTTHLLVPVPGFVNLIAAQQGASLPVATDGTTVAAYVNAISDAVTAGTSANAMLVKYSGTDAVGPTQLYDARVGKAVNVVNLDIGRLNTFISNDMSGAFNGVVYVYDTATYTSGSAPNTVLLKNAAILPSPTSIPNPAKGVIVSPGLTVASQNPIYVQGNYNTGLNPASSGSTVTASSSNVGTYANGTTPYVAVPASVIGDAIMLLSTAWTDANSSLSLSSRRAANTTYNAALLGGWQGTTSTNFSGGAVNFPRFLEDWQTNNNSCTYWGSMAEMFPSQTFPQPWQAPGTTTYNPPTRYYIFDPQFSHVAPPGTVAAVVLSRGMWSKYP